MTKAQAIKKVLADNKSDIDYLMGKETRYTFNTPDQARKFLLDEKKFKQGRITYDKYHNKIIHMILVKKK